MKGISTVIGALLVLIITLVLAGLAYTYITATASTRIATVLEVDGALTRCTGTTITVGVKNSGTNPILWSSIKVSGTKSDTTPITEVSCTNTGNLVAGLSGTCTTAAAITGTAGNNKVVVTGGGSSAQGIVYCTG